MTIRNMFIGGLAGIVLGLTACDPEDPPTSDSGYDASSDAGNPDGGPPDSGYDGGLDAGYDAGNPDGGNDNLPPVVIIEAKDDQGNVKDTFLANSYATFDLNKSYDPNCITTNTCGESKGMDYCEWSDNGRSGSIYFPPEDSGKQLLFYTTGGRTIIFHANCYKRGSQNPTSAEKNITIQ